MSAETVTKTGEYEFWYIRHGKSESNREGNTGVHILDPVLLQGKEDKESGLQGRMYCQTHLASAFSNTHITHIAVSPLSRAISTMILSLPWNTLVNARITVMPLLEEQTNWFSDRPRYYRQIRMLIDKEVALKASRCGHVPSQLRVNFSLLLEEELYINPLASYKKFEEAVAESEFEQLREAQASQMAVEVLNKPWHTKTGLWDPENLLKRSEKCRAELASWMRTAFECYEETKLRGVRDCPQFAVFGHGGFVNYLAEEVGGIRPDELLLSAWRTGEHRRYAMPYTAAGDQITNVGLFCEPEYARLKRLLGQGVAAVDARKSYDLQNEQAKREELHAAVTKLKEKDFRSIHAQSYKAARTEIPGGLEGADDAYVTKLPFIDLWEIELLPALANILKQSLGTDGTINVCSDKGQGHRTILVMTRSNAGQEHQAKCEAKRDEILPAHISAKTTFLFVAGTMARSR